MKYLIWIPIIGIIPAFYLLYRDVLFYYMLNGLYHGFVGGLIIVNILNS